MKSLKGKKLGAYILAIRFKAMRIHGHFDLFVYLNDKNGIMSREPCIRGLYSKGRSDASYHFFDAQFFPIVHFENLTVNLIDENLAGDLFKLVGTIIRPGGQLYLSYHNDELFIREMNKAFRNRIPPIATILGRFLVISGRIRVKSFYGAEWRFRIEGEKPKDTKTAVKWAHEMLNEIATYLIKKVMNSTSPSLPKQRDQAIHYSFICTKPHAEC